MRFAPRAALLTASSLLALSGTLGALAYVPGSVGYDIGYPQCGGSYPAAVGQPLQTARPAAISAASTVIVPRQLPTGIAGTSRATAPSAVKPSPVTPSSVAFASFGILGVDSGFPFMSSQHPGNPCLANEYQHTPGPAFYVNTGYDPSYTDANHTTTSCASQESAIQGTVPQQMAWAVGCSEAQGDFGYVSQLGIPSAAGWWLDVEVGNSWCGQPGTNCSDRSLNQYTLQGIIDTLTHIGATPIGIYSNRTQWSAIVGSLSVSGASSDWIASGTDSAQAASAFCPASNSFSGAPVALVQFVNTSVDHDYVC